VKCSPHEAIALGDLTNNSKGELESRRSSGGDEVAATKSLVLGGFEPKKSIEMIGN
jgi:hypothetical protein